MLEHVRDAAAELASHLRDHGPHVGAHDSLFIIQHNDVAPGNGPLGCLNLLRGSDTCQCQPQ
jgi:hypothetical protein